MLLSYLPAVSHGGRPDEGYTRCVIHLSTLGRWFVSVSLRGAAVDNLSYWEMDKWRRCTCCVARRYFCGFHLVSPTGTRRTITRTRTPSTADTVCGSAEIQRYDYRCDLL